MQDTIVRTDLAEAVQVAGGHLHIWASNTYYVDRCVDCGHVESILEEGHYDDSRFGGLLLSDELGNAKFVSPSSLRNG